MSTDLLYPFQLEAMRAAIERPRFLHQHPSAGSCIAYVRTRADLPDKLEANTSYVLLNEIDMRGDKVEGKGDKPARNRAERRARGER